MRKHYVRNDNLRRCLEEFDQRPEDLTEELFERMLDELRHSNLIIAANVKGDSLAEVAFVMMDERKFGFLFTDMDEFRKFVPDGRCGSATSDLALYKRMVNDGAVDGFVINPAGEAFVMVREMFDAIKNLPQHEYLPDDAYTSEELKDIRDSINNERLEIFIQNPANNALYEQLFEEISHSTLLTLMVSRQNLDFLAEDGMISMVDEPLGFLYIDDMGGRYATVYTSEDKIADVPTHLNKYSQIVNFSQLANYALNDDLDGIIINPNSDNVTITREVLLEYWPLLEDWCNDQRLNTAIMHMFLIKEEA
jgi:hypothetical protein